MKGLEWGRVYEFRNHTGQIKAAIKSVLELCKVAWNMLCSNVMIRPFYSVLNIAKDSVDPFKCRMINRFLSTPSDMRFMKTTDLGEGFKAG